MAAPIFQTSNIQHPTQKISVCRLCDWMAVSVGSVVVCNLMIIEIHEDGA